jgi:hypothetical protein
MKPMMTATTIIRMIGCELLDQKTSDAKSKPYKYMIFIIYNHHTNQWGSNQERKNNGMNAVHLFIFYFGLVLLYHATTRIK